MLIEVLFLIVFFIIPIVGMTVHAILDDDIPSLKEDEKKDIFSKDRNYHRFFEFGNLRHSDILMAIAPRHRGRIIKKVKKSNHLRAGPIP